MEEVSRFDLDLSLKEIKETLDRSVFNYEKLDNLEIILRSQLKEGVTGSAMNNMEIRMKAVYKHKKEIRDAIYSSARMITDNCQGLDAGELL